MSAIVLPGASSRPDPRLPFSFLTGALLLVLSGCTSTNFNNPAGYGTVVSVQSFEWTEASGDLVRENGTTLPLNASDIPLISDTELVLEMTNLPAQVTIAIYTDASCGTESLIEATSSSDGTLRAELDLSSLSEGDHTLYAGFNVDGAESRCGAIGARFTLDRTPPEAPSGVAMQSPATTTGNDRTPTIRVSGVNSGDTIRLYTSSSCSTPTRLESGVATGTTIDLTTESLEDGTHDFYADAVDEAGNASECSSIGVTYTLDGTAPSTTGLTNDASPTPSKTWTWGCSEASCTYRHAVDTSSSGTPTGAYGATTTATQATGDGSYYLHVQARDSAGNESAVMTVSATLDNTAPTLTGLSSDATAAKTKSWTWDCSEASCTYQFVVDTAAATTPASAYGSTTSTTQATGDGTYYVHVRAKDAAGNLSTVAHASALLDNSPPSLTGLSTDPSPTKSKTWSWSCSEASCTYRYVIDTTSNTTPSTGYGATTTDTQSSGDGTYYIHVQARDAAGNTSVVSHVSAVLDNTAPSVTGISDDATPAKSKTWTWSCSEASCTYRHAIDTSAATAPAGAYSSTATNSQGSGDATYYVHVQARDAAGNESTVVHGSVLLDNTAAGTPSGLSLVTPAASPGNNTTPTIQVSGVASGDIVAIFSNSGCTAPGLKGYATSSGATINITVSSALSDGSHVFYAQSKDAAGNASGCSTANVAYTLDTVAPAAPSSIGLFSPSSSPGNDNTPEVGVTVSVEATGQTAKLYNASTTSDCTAGNYLGSSDTIISALLNVTSSTLTEGSYRLRATTTDAAGNISACSTAFADYVVDTTAPSPGGTPISIESGATHSWDKMVDVAFSATGATKMCLAKNSDCSGCVDTAYSASTTTSFSSGSAVRNVSVIFKDDAGNQTACQTDSIQVTDLDAGPTPVYSGKGSFFDRIDSTTGTDCGTAEVSRTEKCSIGAELLEFATAYTSCAGLSLSDGMGWASWKCGIKNGVATFSASISTSKNRLTDYMNTAGASPAWLVSALDLNDGGTHHVGIGHTWWSDTLAWLPDSSGSPQTLSSSGTLYVFKTSATSRGYTIGANRVGIVGTSSATLTWNNAGVANCISNTKKCLVQDFNHTRGIVQANLNGNTSVGVPVADYGIAFLGNDTGASDDSDPWFGKAMLQNFASHGIYVFGIARPRFTSITVNQATVAGIGIDVSQGALVSDIQVANAGTGVASDESFRLSLANVTVANATTGLYFQEAWEDNRLSNIKVSNSTTGIFVDFDTSGFVLVGAMITSVGTGIRIADASNLKIMRTTVAKSTGPGIRADGSGVIKVTNLVLNNVLLANTGTTEALHLAEATDVHLINFASANNDLVDGEITLKDTSEVHVHGNLVLTQSSSMCGLAGTNAPNVDLDDGLTTDCGTDTGNAVTGWKKSTGLDMSGDFVGAPGMTDTANATASAYGNQTTYANVADWWNFIGEWRAWGALDGATSDPMAVGVGTPICTTGLDCQIWDWSLNSTSPAVRSSNDFGGTLNTAFTVSSSCPALLTDGSSTMTIGTQTFKRLAVEDLLDGMGDDDGYCESGETCLYVPNYGYFQGQYFGGLGPCDTSTSGTYTFRGFGSASF